MAFSKPVSTSVVLANADSDGFTMLRESLHYFRAALCQFRVCHDLCATSNLLHEESVMNLDQCATEFRSLSTTVATLAEKIGSVWCRTCLLFYRNIEKVKGNPADVLRKISTQSKELSDGFKEVVSRSAMLAEKFGAVEARKKTTQQEITRQFEAAKQQLKEQGENVHGSIITEAQESTEPTPKVQESTESTAGDIDAKNMVELMGTVKVPTIWCSVPKEPVMKQVVGTFESHQQKASEEKKKAEEAFERTQILTHSLKLHANAKHLRWWAKKTHQFLPLQILFPNVHAQAAAADFELVDAQAHEQNAKEKLQEAQRELDKRTDQVEKAKVNRFCIIFMHAIYYAINVITIRKTQMVLAKCMFTTATKISTQTSKAGSNDISRYSTMTNTAEVNCWVCMAGEITLYVHPIHYTLYDAYLIPRYLCTLQVLASELTGLMVALGQVSLIYNLIQTFWSLQEEYYGDLSKKVDSLEELQKDPDFTNEAAQQKAKWLSDEKELLEDYHRALTVVNSSYNFSTKL